MKIAIAGYGIEGEQNYDYFSSAGHDVTIVDEKLVPDKPLPAGAKTLLGPGVFSQLDGFDMVVRTASLDPSRIKTTGKIWSATNEFFARCPAPIIGATGSKGKGTTCSFITSILRAAGKTVHLVGNIGVPALSLLSEITPDDIVVYELSSFQLWDAERSPEVAVITPIEAEEHLDVHHDLDDYLAAKAHIRCFQTVSDVCFYAPDNQLVQEIVDRPAAYTQNPTEARDWHFRAYRYGAPNERDYSVPAAYLNRGMFIIHRPDQPRPTVVHANSVSLPGEFNLINACAAICAALMFNVSDAAIEEGLRSFHGLPHRLEFVAEKSGVRYYDDSIATTPGSSIAAVKSFDAPKVVILGGSSKGAHYDELAANIAAQNVRCVVVIGSEASAIEQALQAHEVVVFNLGQQVTMSEVVQFVASRTAPGDVVLLSPACASFGMFKNYSDRGEQFVAAVRALN